VVPGIFTSRFSQQEGSLGSEQDEGVPHGHAHPPVNHRRTETHHKMSHVLKKWHCPIDSILCPGYSGSRCTSSCFQAPHSNDCALSHWYLVAAFTDTSHPEWHCPIASILCPGYSGSSCTSSCFRASHSNDCAPSHWYLVTAFTDISHPGFLYPTFLPSPTAILTDAFYIPRSTYEYSLAAALSYPVDLVTVTLRAPFFFSFCIHF
jgi:hypothetical protein